jgi:hypothetical protein
MFDILNMVSSLSDDYNNVSFNINACDDNPSILHVHFIINGKKYIAQKFHKEILKRPDVVKSLFIDLQKTIYREVKK